MPMQRRLISVTFGVVGGMSDFSRLRSLRDDFSRDFLQAARAIRDLETFLVELETCLLIAYDKSFLDADEDLLAKALEGILPIIDSATAEEIKGLMADAAFQRVKTEKVEQAVARVQTFEEPFRVMGFSPPCSGEPGISTYTG